MYYGSSSSGILTGYMADVKAVKLSENPFSFPENKWLFYSESTNLNVDEFSSERHSFRLRDYLCYTGMSSSTLKLIKKELQAKLYNRNNNVRPDQLKNYIVETRDIVGRRPVTDFNYWEDFFKRL